MYDSHNSAASYASKNQDTGMAIKNEMNTSVTKSFDNNFQRLNTDAPNTLRTPISLVRCSAINDAIPKRPKTANEYG